MMQLLIAALLPMAFCYVNIDTSRRVKVAAIRNQDLNLLETETPVLLYTLDSLRVLDNPIRSQIYNRRLIEFPAKHLLVMDENFVTNNPSVGWLIQSAAKELEFNMKTLGEDLIVLNGDTFEKVNEFLKTIQNPHLIYCSTDVYPYISLHNKLELISTLHGTRITRLKVRWTKDSKSLSFKPFLKSYETFSPRMMMGDAEFYGETFANKLVLDYIRLGEERFTHEYEETYIQWQGKMTSTEHVRALRRLASTRNQHVNSTSPLYVDTIKSHFFQGEIISALLSPLLALGCISLSAIREARSLYYKELLQNPVLSLPPHPVLCRLRQEVQRKSWHLELLQSLQVDIPVEVESIAKARDESGKRLGLWKITFRTWLGYLVREGRMVQRTKEGNVEESMHSPTHQVSAASSSSPSKPLLVFVHGFGGSLQQFSSAGLLLSDYYEVHGIDLIGFGQSEKPPISYSQYLWRDQVVTAVKNILRAEGEAGRTRKVVLAGNSIGGYIAAAAAAQLASEDLCHGLVLFNSAGRLLSPTEYRNALNLEPQGGDSQPQPQPLLSDLEELFPLYTGPSPELLRIFGSLIFTLLQPRIERTCTWLYPTYPDVVSRGLAENILRDSRDPGAADVIAAGGETVVRMEPVYSEISCDHLSLSCKQHRCCVS